MVAPTASIDYRSIRMVSGTDGWIAGKNRHHDFTEGSTSALERSRMDHRQKLGPQSF